MPYPEACRRFGRDAAREVWEVYRESHERLRSFASGLPDDCGYRQQGAFLLAMDRRVASLLADGEDMLREDGFAGEFLDHYMLEARLSLAGFAGGYWSADDAEVDPSRLERALRKAARERGAVDAQAGSVHEIAASPGGVDILGDRDPVRVAVAVVAQPAALAWVGRSSLTAEAAEI